MVCVPWNIALCLLSEPGSKFRSPCSILWPCCLYSKDIVWFPCLDWIQNLTHYFLSHLETKRQQQKMFQPYAQPWILCQDSSHVLISSPTPARHQEAIHPWPLEHRKEVAWEICLVSSLSTLTWPPSSLSIWRYLLSIRQYQSYQEREGKLHILPKVHPLILDMWGAGHHSLVSY